MAPRIVVYYFVNVTPKMNPCMFKCVLQNNYKVSIIEGTVYKTQCLQKGIKCQRGGQQGLPKHFQRLATFTCI